MYDLNELKDKIAVIGVGNTKYGNFPEIDDYGLADHAFRNAVNDCGIDKNQIDGLLVSRMGEVVVSNLTDTTENLRMGAPVKVVFDTVSEDLTLPKFALV